MTTSTDSSTSTGAASTGATTTDTGAGSDTDHAADAAKWKNLSRQHEQNAEKLQKELNAIKAANQTDAEKAAEQARQAEDRFNQLEATVKRQRVALEHKLSPDDAALLDTITDEAAMRTLATRLATDAAAANGSKRTNGIVVKKEGQTAGKAGTEPVREFARQLFRRGED